MARHAVKSQPYRSLDTELTPGGFGPQRSQRSPFRSQLTAYWVKAADGKLVCRWQVE